MIRARHIATLWTAAAFLLAAFVFLCFCQPAHAVTGNVYKGTLERCYRHPVTGVIEDSGGEGEYATGQGMVEGCLSTKCMLEVTDSGYYFLTIRLGLIDYTKNREFEVQKWGAKKWSAAKFIVTKKGKDKGETAYDYCIRIPSQKSIVRMSMFVKPIGRNVICYLYPTKLKIGTQPGMVAKIVTEKSKKGGDKTLESGRASSKPAEASKSSSSGTSEAGAPKAGEAVASAQGLTLSTAVGASGSQVGATQADLQLTPPSPSWRGWRYILLACVSVLAVVVVVAIAFRRRRAREIASDSDDYSRAYAAQVAGDSHEGGDE